MKIRSKLLTKWAAWLAVKSSQLLFSTCRKVYLAPEDWLRLDFESSPENTLRGVLCVWHDELLIPTLCATESARKQACALVSQHQDGSYLAEAMTRLGFSTVRGSSKRGGAQAVKQLLDDTAGKHILITPDGPRGPRREMKVGAVYVASQTGRPICPGSYVCKSAWRYPGSWTDLVIPKPFTTIYLVTGKPIPIPSDLSREELQHYVIRVQLAMEHLSDQATKLMQGEIQAIDYQSPDILEYQAAA